MNIGIMCAMKEEYKELIPYLTDVHSSSFQQFEITKGKINHNQISLILSGIGKVSAALAVDYLVAKEDVDLIIVAGLAGSLDNKLQIGDIVLVDQAVAHDCWHPDFIKNWNKDIISCGSRVYKTNGLLLDTLAEATENFELDFPERLTRITKNKSSQIVTGAIATGDLPVLSRTDISQGLLDVYPAICVDMETAAVYQAAVLHSIPCVSVRCISDIVGHQQSVLAILRYVQPLCQHLASFLSYVLPVLIEKQRKFKEG